MKSLLFAFLIILNVSVSFAQESRHPRVREVEDKIKSEASSFIKTRYPDLPFLISVNIEPLRRKGAENQNYETMPWYTLENEEIKDEWDDPSATLYQLISRVTKVQVQVEVPQNIGDKETLEIREALVKELRLIPSRDSISFEKREWTYKPKTEDPDYRTIFSIAGPIVLFSLLGLFVVLRFTNKKTAVVSSKESSARDSDNYTPSNQMASMNMGQGSAPASATNFNSTSQDVNFLDPLKIKEVIQLKAQQLATSLSFPTLEDLVELDRLANERPALLGAILMQFPAEKQRQLFAHGASKQWYEALVQPGQLDSEGLKVFDRLNRVKSNQFDRKWEDLRIQLWRLQDELEPFLKTLSIDVAFKILYSLPRSISLNTARSIFPGKWAALLDPNFVPKFIADKEVDQLLIQTLKLKEPLSFESLEGYRREKDLLDYLTTATIEEERDVYGAGDTAVLVKARPPFFSVLEYKDIHLKSFVEQVSLDDWALCMFNVPKNMRTTVESHFSQKAKFLYYEKLKLLDRSNVAKFQVGTTREKIARHFQQTISITNKTVKLKLVESEQVSEGQDEISKAV